MCVHEGVCVWRKVYVLCGYVPEWHYVVCEWGEGGYVSCVCEGVCTYIT